MAFFRNADSTASIAAASDAVVLYLGVSSVALSDSSPLALDDLLPLDLEDLLNKPVLLEAFGNIGLAALATRPMYLFMVVVAVVDTAGSIASVTGALVAAAVVVVTSSGVDDVVLLGGNWSSVIFEG